MIDAAKDALEILGKWECEIEPAGAVPGIGVDSFRCQKGGAFETVTRWCVVPDAAPEHVDASRWGAGESGPDQPGLMLVMRDDQDKGGVERIAAAVRDAGGRAEALTWSAFVNTLVNVTVIRTHYQSLWEKYEASEGENFIYVQPAAVDEDTLEKKAVFEWVESLGDAASGSEAAGSRVLLSGYGEGKTSFCLNYVFKWLKEESSGAGTPLLFLLNEWRAGSVDQFILTTLRTHYGLSVSYDEFVRLCDHGIFIPVLDAFDQMSHGAGGLRIERDFGQIHRLGRGRSPVYVTCRRAFYDQHLKSLWGRIRKNVPGDRLLTLRGFDDIDLEKALRGRETLLSVLTDPAHQKLLAGLHRKPLLLRVMATEETEFLGLLKQCKTDRSRLTEFKLFDLLYQRWLRGPFQGFRDGQEAGGFCRGLAARIRLDGLNQAMRLDDLLPVLVASGNGADADRRTPIIADLKTLPLLDTSRLDAEPVEVCFRFNVYLEFLIAHSVLGELRGPDVGTAAPFIRGDVLTPETRQLLVRDLVEDRHADPLMRMIDDTRMKAFREVEYQGTNALTLLLDKLQDPETAEDERSAWREHLDKARLRDAVLPQLDARGALLVGRDFSGCDLRDADFSFAVLKNVSFAKADLTGARFLEAGAVMTATFVDHTGGPSEAPSWRVAGGTEAGMVFIWDANTRTPRRHRLHHQRVSSLVAHPEDQRLFSASHDGALSDLSLRDGGVNLCMPLGHGPIRALAWAPDGRTLLTGGDQDFVGLWSLSDQTLRKMVLTTGRFPGVVCALAVCDNPLRVFVGDSTGRVLGFDTAAPFQAPAPVFQGTVGGRVRSIVPVGGGDALVLSDAGSVSLLDAGGTIQADVLSERDVRAMCFAADAGHLFWLSGQNLWRMTWPNSSTRVVICLVDQDKTYTTLGCSPDGTFIAAGGNYLTVWHLTRSGADKVHEDSLLLDCRGLSLYGAKGLSPEDQERLRERGAQK